MCPQSRATQTCNVAKWSTWKIFYNSYYDGTHQRKQEHYSKLWHPVCREMSKKSPPASHGSSSPVLTAFLPHFCTSQTLHTWHPVVHTITWASILQSDRVADSCYTELWLQWLQFETGASLGCGSFCPSERANSDSMLHCASLLASVRKGEPPYLQEWKEMMLGNWSGKCSSHLNKGEIKLTKCLCVQERVVSRGVSKTESYHYTAGRKAGQQGKREQLRIRGNSRKSKSKGTAYTVDQV